MQRPGALTLSEAVLPRPTLLINALLVLLGSAVVAVCAQITIFLDPVPITGQTFAVLLVGVSLGSRRGALAMLAYLGEGLAGLPVFAQASSAWAPLNRFGEPPIVGSTLGYLVGFVFAAFVVGWLAERYGMDRAPWSAAMLLLVGNIVLFVPGLIWLQMWLTAHAVPSTVWQAGLLPFIAGDVIKLLAAAVLAPSAWELVRTRTGFGGLSG
jgi:biotin transport system substrate-specific component